MTFVYTLIQDHRCHHICVDVNKRLASLLAFYGVKLAKYLFSTFQINNRAIENQRIFILKCQYVQITQ